MTRIAAWLVAAWGAVIGGQPALAQTPIPPAPQDFAMAASESDHYELLAATVAVTQSSDPRVRAFAERILQDHKRLDEALRQAATTSGLKLPASGLSSDQALLLASLQSLRGAEFDQGYARQQVLAHTQAAAVEDSFAASGSDPNLRAAAQAALPTIRDHLKQAQQLAADLDHA